MIAVARECHACQMLTRGLRAADVAEIKAASGLEPEVALPRSLKISAKAWVVLKNGYPFVMFGVAPWHDNPAFGCPWMVSTVDLRRHLRELVVYTKQYVAESGKDYVALTNFVHAGHRDSIRWLTHAGFSFIDFVPQYGAGKQPFLQFFKATQHV